GKQFVTFRDMTTFTVYDTDTGAAAFTEKTPFKPVISAAFHPDGKRLAVGAFDGLVRVYDVPSKTHLYSINGQLSWILGLAYSPDGAWLVTSAGDPIFEL